MTGPTTPDHAGATAHGYAARLWAAGLATAVVAGLVALAGTTEVVRVRRLSAS